MEDSDGSGTQSAGDSNSDIDNSAGGVKGGGGWLSFWRVPSAIIVAIVALLLYRSLLKDGDVLPYRDCTPECIRHALKRDLVTEFPSQPEASWRKISACVIQQFNGTVVAKPPRSPSVLLLAPSGGGGGNSSHEAASLTLNRLLERLTQLLSSGIASCNCPYANGCKDFDVALVADQVTQRREVDDAAEAAFNASVRCLKLRALERLSGDAAKIFYRLADTTDAVYRPFLYVLTVGNQGGLATEAEVRSELQGLWLGSGLNPDSSDPIWARIGSNVLFVLPERIAGAGAE